MNYKTYGAYRKNIDNYQKNEKDKGKDIFSHPFHAVFDVSQDIYITEEKISDLYNKCSETNT